MINDKYKCSALTSNFHILVSSRGNRNSIKGLIIGEGGKMSFSSTILVTHKRNWIELN